MIRTSFYWVFRRWLDRYSPYALVDGLGVSEKTIYSWSVPPTSNFHRQNPLDRAKQIADILHSRSPDLLFEYLQDLAGFYGYDIVKKENIKHFTISQTHKELTDVIQSLLQAYEDGQITEEEAKQITKEIKEAMYVLQEKLAEFSKMEGR